MQPVITHMLEDAGVAALVRARVYPKRRPQNSATPALVLHQISGPQGSTYAGPDGLVKARIQVDCLGQTYGEAKDLAKVVTAAAWRARAAPLQIFVLDEGDDEEEGQVADQTLFSVRVELRAFFPAS